MKYSRPIILIVIIVIAWTALYYFDKIYSYGSSEWGKDLKKCTDIWQSTHNETLYYDCMNPLEKAYGVETHISTVTQYVKEIKFQTCYTMFDIYNLSSYYKCVGI